MKGERDSKHKLQWPPKRTLVGVLLLVYWGGLFVGTHIPNPEDVVPSQVSDKWLHFLAYAGLSLLLSLWLRMGRDAAGSRSHTSVSRRPRWQRLHRLHADVRVFAVLALYAAADELLQGIPALNRTPEFADWFADLGGVALGVVLLRGAELFTRIWYKKKAAS